MTIDIKNSQIYQKNDLLVLNNINLEVKAGEFCYLIGKTGSGKSSLLKALYGELEVNGDCFKVAGYDMQNLRESQIPALRRKLGIVFQDFQLLHDRNVFDNLMFVLRATSWKNRHDMEKRIHTVLSQVGLSTKSHKMTFELSGGEQQRVCIARALLNSPELIIADEPTGNLDPSISDEIMSLLFSISKEGTSVIMATHDYRLLNQFAGNIYRVENGTLRPAESH